MNILMITRFNNYTWNENKRWRKENAHLGCIYNSPIHIKDLIPLESILYIIEMNNDTNKILGFGKIINKVYTNKNYHIYDDRNYNRYTYKGYVRIDINNIQQQYQQQIEQIEKLENRLFKTKSHLKRGQGIQQVPNNVSIEYFSLIKELFNI